MTIRGVSFESMNARATRPARPRLWAGTGVGWLTTRSGAEGWGASGLGSRTYRAWRGCPSCRPLAPSTTIGLARKQPGQQLEHAVHALAGLDQAHLGNAVGGDENQFHLAPLHQRGEGNSERRRGVHRHRHPRELARPQPRSGGKIQLGAERPAHRIGDRRQFGHRALELLAGRGHADGEARADLEPAAQGFGNIGIEAESGGVFEFDQGATRTGEIPHVGQFPSDDAGEGGDQPGVAQQGLGLAERRLSHP